MQKAVNISQSRFAFRLAFLGCFRIRLVTQSPPALGQVSRCLDLKFKLFLFSFALRLASRTAQHLRKEVIQPHLPIRLPCYDFTPVIAPALDGCLLAVGPPALGVHDFRGVTGGVYKARERIHRSMLTCDY